MGEVSEQIFNDTSAQLGYTCHSCWYVLENMGQKTKKSRHYKN